MSKSQRIEPIQTKQRAGSVDEALSPGSVLTGVQHLYRFDNGYGASVVRSHGTYGAETGLWELAVIRWTAAGFKITYDTPITEDVIGWLSDDDVQEKLRAIRDLPELTTPSTSEAGDG